MISDAMKSNIPSSDASTRELLCAGGGPWCASAVRVGGVASIRRSSVARRRRARRGRPVLADALDEVAPQPARALRAGNVETMISSTRSSRMACMAAVYGSGWAIWPCTSMPRRGAPSARAAAAARPRGAGLPWIALRRDDQEARRAALRAGAGSPGAARRRRPSRSRSRARAARPSPSRARSTTTCSTGTSRAIARIESTTLRRSQPDRCSGCVDTTTSSTGGSSCAIASRAASAGSASTANPCAWMPAPRSAWSVLSRRRRAAVRRLSS